MKWIMNRKMSVLLLTGLGLTACVTVENGETRVHKSALYGVLGAAGCGAAGAILTPDGGNAGKHARNSAIVCGGLGALAGSIAENNINRLREDINKLDRDVVVSLDKQNSKAEVVFPEEVIFLENGALNQRAYKPLQRVAQYLRDNPMATVQVVSYVADASSESQNKAISQKQANAVSNYLKSKMVNNQLSSLGKGSDGLGVNSTNRVVIIIR